MTHLHRFEAFVTPSGDVHVRGRNEATGCQPRMIRWNTHISNGQQTRAPIEPLFLLYVIVVLEWFFMRNKNESRRVACRRSGRSMKKINLSLTLITCKTTTTSIFLL